MAKGKTKSETNGQRGGVVPEISLMSTCEASSFSFKVADMESGVMPEVLAAAAAWVSVSAAPFIVAKSRVQDCERGVKVRCG